MQTIRIGPRAIKWVGLLVFIPDVLYAAGWFLMDVLARNSRWPRDWDFVDIYGFVATHSIWAEMVFFVGLAFKIAALVQIIRSRLSAITLLAIAVVLHFVDWMLLTGNGYYSATLDGGLQIASGIVALSCLVYLNMQGALTGRSIIPGR